MRVLVNGQNIFKAYRGGQFNIHRKLEDFELINDIRNDQQTPIGELHFDNIGGYTRTIFSTHEGDKVVVNEILFSNNRINYNLGYTPSKFTAIFDYKAGGGNGADGGYFYFYAKGTSNPNDNEQCSVFNPEGGEDIVFACDSFPIGKYNNPDQDAYRIHFDEYSFNEQIAISWGGYVGTSAENLIATIGQAYPEYPAGFDFGDGIWRKIKINFNEGFFKVFIDGELKLQAQDPYYSYRDFTGNNFGLGGYVGGLFNYHYFKNFKLYNIIF